uniref:Transposase Tc1-like domain-containing protein n=1 Tax=Esox lucius TaxID=8010 RepID=A0A3P8YGI7_ESOLU
TIQGSLDTKLSDTIKRHLETEEHFDRKRSGRPKATTESEDKFLRVNSLAHMQLNTGRCKQVSVSTVKRRLRAAGLIGQLAWTTEDWKVL